jgi:hypothetical protein
VQEPGLRPQLVIVIRRFIVPSDIYKGKAYPYLENQIPTLSDAESKTQFVRVRCIPCKITRYFCDSNFGVFELQ